MAVGFPANREIYWEILENNRLATGLSAIFRMNHRRLGTVSLRQGFASASSAKSLSQIGFVLSFALLKLRIQLFRPLFQLALP
jgi:hypothetical protein